MNEVRNINLQELRINQGKFLELLDKYYKKVQDECFNAVAMYESICQRIANEGSILLAWGNYEGFITCDFKINPIKRRKEAVIWTVYNPDPSFKSSVLNMIEAEARKRGIDAIVFFAEKPMAFNKLVKKYGYACTLGYFEKDLKGENKCQQ